MYGYSMEDMVNAVRRLGIGAKVIWHVPVDNGRFRDGVYQIIGFTNNLVIIKRNLATEYISYPQLYTYNRAIFA